MRIALAVRSGEWEKAGRVIYPIAILAAVLIVFSVTLYFPFHFDDELFLRDDNIKLGRTGAFLIPPSPRFLVWLTFLIQYQLHGPSSAYFHGLNVLIHAANSILVFFLILTILRSDMLQKGSNLSRSGVRLSALELAAFFGGLLFALHPIQTEAVVYIYQRSTLLGTFFSILCLWAHIKRRKVATVIFMALAIVSKEFTLVLPLLLWLWDGLKTRSWRPARFIRLLFAASFIAGTLGWLTSYGGEISWDAFYRRSLSYAGAQVEVFWGYLSLITMLGSQNLDHQVLGNGLLRPLWWLSLFGIVVLLGLGFGFRKRWPLLVFFGGLYGGFLLPTSSFLPSPDLMFEHRLYPSLAGCAGILSVAVLYVTNLKASRSIRITAAAFGRVLPGLLIILLAGEATGRIRVWHSNTSLWQDAVSKSPSKYRPNYNLGVLLVEEAPSEAIRHLRTAVAIDPTSPLAYRALGEAYLQKRDLKQAQVVWEMALDLDKGDPETYLELGRLCLSQSDYLKAKRLLSKAHEIAPRKIEVYYQLALLEFRFGYLKKALSWCEEGLGIDTTDWRLRLLLADIVAQRKNYPRAIELYLQVLEESNRSEVYYKLARTYWAIGQPEKAGEALRNGMQRASSPEMAFLGRSYLRGYQLLSR